MPSGGITITPGKIMGPVEKVSNTKLNQGFRPVGRTNAKSITDRELDDATNRILSASSSKNLFCNGDFQLWDYFTGGFGTLSGVISGGWLHDYGSANRWVTANDAARAVTRELFSDGQTEVPDFPRSFLRWIQSAPVTTDPSYFGQRLEDTRILAGKTMTVSFWVRAASGLTITPKLRQFFGTGGSYSAAVVLTGTPVALVGDVWTRVEQTFAVPAVAGKTISTDDFTEFRLDVPQGSTFQIDFAHAQLEKGNSATGFELRMLHEEYVYALHFYEVVEIMLSTNITVWKPFINAKFPKRRAPTPTLVAHSGTGATIAVLGLDKNFAFQNANHDVVDYGTVTWNGELYA